MTDNEWAAEWLDIELGVTPFRHEQCVAGGGPLWKPDADLNQFKLVLDKFHVWSDLLAGRARRDAMEIREDAAHTAWDYPATMLARIREAVEK